VAVLSIAQQIVLARKHDFTDDELPDVCAVIMTESGGDTRAVQRNGKGRGIVQIDLGEHPDVTEEQAFDPDFAMSFARGLSRNPHGLGPPNWYGPRDHPQEAEAARVAARAVLAQEGRTVTDVPNAQKALDWLQAHLGTAEYPAGSNRNFVTDWAGLGPVAWCDECLWASECVAWGCYDSRQLPDDYPLATDYSWGDAYVPSTRHHFRLAGRYVQVPTIGAAAIFNWSGIGSLTGWSDAQLWSDNPSLPPTAVLTGIVAYEDIGDHIGRVAAWVDTAGNRRTDWPCVEADWDRTVITYEGNTGDALLERRRPMTLIDGFGVMVYPTPEPIPQPHEEDDAMRLIGVTNNRGIFMVGSQPLATGKAKGKVPAVYIGTPDEVRALNDAGAAVRDESKPDLPEAVFDRRYVVVG
jgi:hypothetical protein